VFAFVVERRWKRKEEIPQGERSDTVGAAARFSPSESDIITKARH